MLKKCPICGEKMLKSEDVFTAQCGTTAINSKVLDVVKCPKCDVEFYADDNKSSKLMWEAMQEARQKSVVEKLEKLEKETPLIDIERCLALPMRTLSKWKNGTKKPSAAAVALINLVGVFPWLLGVAANNYDYKTAHAIAFRELFKKANESKRVSVFGFSNNDCDVIGIVNNKALKTQQSNILQG